MLNFDELNILEIRARQTPLIGLTKEEVEDWVLDYIVEFVYLAEASVIDDLGGIKTHLTSSQLRELVDAEIDGKTYLDRIEEQMSALSDPTDPEAAYLAEKAIQTIAVTEAHRVANGVIYEVGKANKARFKRWCSMQDDRVRDTHQYLDGTVVPITADFYSYTGSHGPYPGSFHDPAEDINCRCYIRLSTFKNKV